MTEKTIVFIYEKTGEFVKYHILEIVNPEDAVKDFNDNPKEEQVAKIITEPDVVAAIIQKESRKTIVSYLSDIKNDLSCMETDISNINHQIETAINRLEKDDNES